MGFFFIALGSKGHGFEFAQGRTTSTTDQVIWGDLSSGDIINFEMLTSFFLLIARDISGIIRKIHIHMNGGEFWTNVALFLFYIMGHQVLKSQ